MLKPGRTVHNCMGRGGCVRPIGEGGGRLRRTPVAIVGAGGVDASNGTGRCSPADPYAIERQRTAILKALAANRCRSADARRKGRQNGLFAGLLGNKRPFRSGIFRKGEPFGDRFSAVTTRPPEPTGRSASGTCDGYYFPISFSAERRRTSARRERMSGRFARARTLRSTSRGARRRTEADDLAHRVNPTRRCPPRSGTGGEYDRMHMRPDRRNDRSRFPRHSPYRFRTRGCRIRWNRQRKPRRFRRRRRNPAPTILKPWPIASEPSCPAP